MEGAGRRVERPVVRPCRRPPPPLLAHPLYHTSIGGGPPGRLPGRAPSVPAGAVRLAVCGGGQPPACGGLVGGWRSSGGEGGRQCDGQALHGCSASLRCRAHPAPHPVPRRRAPPPPPICRLSAEAGAAGVRQPFFGRADSAAAAAAASDWGGPGGAGGGSRPAEFPLYCDSNRERPRFAGGRVCQGWRRWGQDGPADDVVAWVGTVHHAKQVPGRLVCPPMCCSPSCPSLFWPICIPPPPAALPLPP